MPEPSGPQWCARFPTSKSLDDLTEPFADSVRAFLSQLNRAGANVVIADTFRPPQRAYLMHWSWGIARGLPPEMCRPGDHPNVPVSPASVPPTAGVPIDWTHGGNSGEARAAAEAMVRGYAMLYCAALESRHTVKRAVDMAITWNGTLTTRDFNGDSHAIAGIPHDGTNSALWPVGRTFGVVKLPQDKPHWSDDGH